MTRSWIGWGLAALIACGAPASESASGTSSGTVVAQDGLPAAILGQGAPPAGETVQYFPGHPATAGYLSLPMGDGPHPSVLLIHEWAGLNDRVRQVADALAAEGYVALAADLYSGRTGATREENLALVRETQSDMDAVIANLDAAQRYLRQREDTVDRVATMGWCFGGGIALSYAIGGEQHEGTAIFYGQLVTDPLVLAGIEHEIYGTFAEMDRGIPPAEVDRFVEALREAGVPNDVHVYDAVDHGFWLWVDRAPEVNAGPALDAWTRLKAFLDRVLR